MDCCALRLHKHESRVKEGRCTSQRKHLALENSTYHSKDKVQILNLAVVQPKLSSLRMTAAGEVGCGRVDVKNERHLRENKEKEGAG